jgi:hypothetical protein
MVLVGDACFEFALRPAFSLELALSRDYRAGPIAFGEPAYPIGFPAPLPYLLCRLPWEVAAWA